MKYNTLWHSIRHAGRVFFPTGSRIWLKELQNFLCHAFSKWRIFLVLEKSVKTFWYQMIWMCRERDSASFLNPSLSPWAGEELLAINRHMSIFFLYHFPGEQLMVIFLFSVPSSTPLLCFCHSSDGTLAIHLCSLLVLRIQGSYSSSQATLGTCRKSRCSLRWLDLNTAKLLWILLIISP